MARPLTLLGIEAPRCPRRSVRGGVDATFNPLRDDALVERCMRAALVHTDKDSIAVISGEPSQEVFDAVERHAVLATDLATWMTRVAERVANAGTQDAVVFLRADVVLRNFHALEKALAALRQTPGLDRVEPAYQPRKQPPTSAFSLETGPDGQRIPRPFPTPNGTLGMLCPAFEVHRLWSFGMAGLARPSAGSGAFVWIDESDFVILETPLDELRASILLEETET